MRAIESKIAELETGEVLQLGETGKIEFHGELLKTVTSEIRRTDPQDEVEEETEINS